MSESDGPAATGSGGDHDPRPLFLTRSDDERSVAYRGPLKRYKAQANSATAASSASAADGGGGGGKPRIVELAGATWTNRTVGQHQFSADGTLAACHDLDHHALVLLDAATGQPRGEPLRVGQKFQVYGLSPTGRFAVTWHRYDPAAPAGTSENLLCWDLRYGGDGGGGGSKCIGRFVQKKLDADTWPTVRWIGPDDSFAARLQPHQVVFYRMHAAASEGGGAEEEQQQGAAQYGGEAVDDGGDEDGDGGGGGGGGGGVGAEPDARGFSRPAWKCHSKGAALFELGPWMPNKDTAEGGVFHVARFSPEVRGSTARVSIFSSARPDRAVNERGLFNAHSAELSFSPSGRALLVLVSSAEDKSGASCVCSFVRWRPAR